MKIVDEFLNRLGISYNKQTVHNFFSIHPYHPSLASISDLLDSFKIDNAGVEIGKENFSRIPVPFIAQTSSSEGDYCLITAVDADNVTYLNEKNEWVNAPLTRFFMQYSGAVLVAEKMEQSGEPAYLVNKKTYQRKAIHIIAAIALVIFAFTAILLYQSVGVTLVPVLLFVLKTLGVAVCVLLLIQTFDAGNPFVNRLCSSNSGNGCSNILGLQAAKIFNGAVSWSEIGFFYFLAGMLVLCLSGGNPATMLFLSLLNLLALPYTVYSIGFQYKAKTWCKLCISIQILLWLEFFTTVSYLSHAFNNFSLYKGPLFLFITTVAISIALWLIVKPFLKANLQIPKLQQDINLFKKDEHIFYTMLDQQPKVEPIPLQYKIALGNPSAAFEITFVSNPYCMPCANMHQKLLPVLEECKNDLLLNIIFTASSNTKDSRNEIIKILMTVYWQKGKDAFEQALHEWFTNGFGHAKAWIEKYYAEGGDTTEELFQAHRDWCEENNITHTPALFLNNHLHLSEYNFNDLKHFIHASAAKQHGQIQMV